MNKPLLILASSSKYRAAQLRQLGLTFEIASPNIDESPQIDEAPPALALRLAQAKAQAIAASSPTAWVLAGDQTAECKGRSLTKPGNVETATQQLQWMRGATSGFYSAFCLHTPEQSYSHITETVVRMRDLTDASIATYINADNPLDCAGSFKIEQRGISLFDWVRSDDPSALTGLPLIEVAKAFNRLGWTIP